MTPDERAGFGGSFVADLDHVWERLIVQTQVTPSPDDPDPVNTWICSELFNGGTTPSFDPCNPPLLRVSCPECIYETSFQAGQGEWSTQHRHDHVCSVLLALVAAFTMLLLFLRNRSNG